MSFSIGLNDAGDRIALVSVGEHHTSTITILPELARTYAVTLFQLADTIDPPEDEARTSVICAPHKNSLSDGSEQNG